jgi:hypothetical protein
MPNRKCSRFIRICSSIWQIELPAAWSDSFQSILGQIEIDRIDRVNVRLSLCEMDGEREAEFKACRQAIPEDNILFHRKGDLQHFMTGKTWSTWNFKTLEGTLSVLGDPDRVILGSNFLSQFFIWGSTSLDYLPIHAACFGQRGKFALMPASAGRGKSTLTWGAYQQGMDVLSDDFCFLEVCQQKICASGPFASIKLRQDSIDSGLQELQPPEKIRFYERDDAKKIVFPSWNGGRDFVGHCTLAYLFVPRFDSSGPSIRSISFNRILPHLNSTYQLVLNAKGNIQWLFGRLNQALKQLPAYEVALGPCPIENIRYLQKWWGT